MRKKKPHYYWLEHANHKMCIIEHSKLQILWRKNFYFKPNGGSFVEWYSKYIMVMKMLNNLMFLFSKISTISKSIRSRHSIDLNDNLWWWFSLGMRQIKLFFYELKLSYFFSNTLNRNYFDRRFRFDGTFFRNEMNDKLVFNHLP